MGQEGRLMSDGLVAREPSGHENAQLTLFAPRPCQTKVTMGTQVGTPALEMACETTIGSSRPLHVVGGPTFKPTTGTRHARAGGLLTGP